MRECCFPVLDHVDMFIPYGQGAIILNICSEPQLFRSVKRPTIVVESITRISMCEMLQQAFPQVYHITTALEGGRSFDSRHLYLGISNSNRSLGSRSNRIQGGYIQTLRTRSLRELNLKVARGSLYRADYDWVGSSVG
jgi:hypothetical protein